MNPNMHISEAGWFIMGTHFPEQSLYVVFASKDLISSTVTLEEALHEFNYSGLICAMPSEEPPLVTFTAETKTYTVTMGKSYEEALKRLFEAWTPDKDRKPVPMIEEEKKSLPVGYDFRLSKG